MRKNVEIEKKGDACQKREEVVPSSKEALDVQILGVQYSFEKF